jgi:peptidyl-prolyl cis-trans isomerase A (cyclophilin A)
MALPVIGRLPAAAALALLGLAGPGTAAGLAQALPRVAIETRLGTIVVEVDSVRAPVTAANFLRYVDAGYYGGGMFHRTVTSDNQPADTVRIEVIQGAADTARRAELFPAIPLERTSVTQIRHLAGTISMARTGPATARDQFFICVTDQSDLDFGGRRNPDGQGFAAFGRVVSGLEVVRTIQQEPAEGQRLTPVVPILRVLRIAVSPRE